MSDTGHFRTPNVVADEWISVLGTNAFAVLSCIARHSSSNGACFPSISRLEKMTGLSRPTVIKSIAALENHNAISRLSTPGRPTKYTVNPPANWLRNFTSKPALPVNDVYHTSKAALPVLVNDVYPNNTNLTIQTNKDSPLAANRALFEAFWLAYPPRNGRKALKKLAGDWWEYHKVNGTVSAQIMAGLEAAKPGWAKEGNRYVPDAIRFLRNEQWKDEIGPEVPLKIDPSEFKSHVRIVEAVDPAEVKRNIQKAKEIFRGAPRVSVPAGQDPAAER